MRTGGVSLVLLTAAKVFSFLAASGFVVLGYFSWLTLLDNRGTFHNTTDLADLDGDGDLDALVGIRNGAMVWVNQGGIQGGQMATFALSEGTISGKQTRAVFLSDLDGDGDLDALIDGLRQAALWWNDGQALFTQSSQRFPYSNRHGLALGDFNGDGHPDIFTAAYSREYRVWFNQGDGTFQNAPRP